MEAFGLSHPGRVRTGNEDAYVVLPSTGLYAVADGMGGAAAGEVASRMAVDTVSAVFDDPDLTWPRRLACPPRVAGLPLLVAGIEHANARVFAAALADRNKAGMGTTFTGILVHGDRIAVGHVGDSRAYLLRGRRLQQLTQDHTLVNHLIDAGAMTRDQAESSQLRHMLSRAVGAEESVDVDRRLVAAEAGDTLLLASDGLHGVVSDKDIAAVLLGERDITRAATRLVEHANDAGGPDNVTVVLIRIG
jgi:serine/threonine protein phosphatase PrpC